MSEYEKMLAGLPYNATDEALLAMMLECQQECFEINQLPPFRREEQTARWKKLLGKTGERLTIVGNFFCDYGRHIEVGEDFFANVGCTILDEAPVRFGNDVFIGPNCSFYTAIHPTNPQERNKKTETAAPITVGDNVWLGGNVTVLPGVCIGSNTTIGAGSVVVKDIPDGVVAVGNPCRPIKKVDIEDKKF